MLESQRELPPVNFKLVGALRPVYWAAAVAGNWRCHNPLAGVSDGVVRRCCYVTVGCGNPHRLDHIRRIQLLHYDCARIERLRPPYRVSQSER